MEVARHLGASRPPGTGSAAWPQAALWPTQVTVQGAGARIDVVDMSDTDMLPERRSWAGEYTPATRSELTSDDSLVGCLPG